MKAEEFKEIRKHLPVQIARSNTNLGDILGVSHHSISKYQNMDKEVPTYIAHSMLMLTLICKNHLLADLQSLLNLMKE